MSLIFLCNSTEAHKFNLEMNGNGRYYFERQVYAPGGT